MNNQRRKEIRKIVLELSQFKTHILNKQFSKEEIEEKLQTTETNISDILSQEEWYMDNIPENMQGGRRYEAAEEACDHLQDAVDSIREATEDTISIKDIITCIDETIEALNSSI